MPDEKTRQSLLTKVIEEENMDDKLYASNEQMKQWIFEFIREIDTIDQFFVDKLQENVRKFINMQMEFLRKIDKEKNAG